MADVAGSKSDIFHQSWPEDWSMTSASIPLYPFHRPTQGSHPSLTSQAMSEVTMTTIIIVASLVTSCIIVACIGAAILRQRRLRLKRLTQKSQVTQSPTYGTKGNSSSEDASIYSEIEPKSHCFCCLREKNTYNVSSVMQVDNVYAEVQDVRSRPDVGKEVIYETVDTHDWPKTRSPSKGSACQIQRPPTFYDHLSFQELEKLGQRRDQYDLAGKTKKSDADTTLSTYDRLDRNLGNITTSGELKDPDENNNRLGRRSSQKQIFRKLDIIEKDNGTRTRKGRLSSKFNHEYLELEDNSDSINKKSSASDTKLEDLCQRRTQIRRYGPSVPVRTSSLGNAMYAYTSTGVPLRVVDELHRRIRSFPDSHIDFRSRDTLDYSATSSEGVYNVTSGTSQRITSHPSISGPLAKPSLNNYFILDTVLLHNEASLECPFESGSLDCNTPCATFRQEIHHYFELESETDVGPHQPVRFHLGDANAEMSNKHRALGKTDSEGVAVVRLGEKCDESPRDDFEENLYDRIRFYSVSLEQKSDFRPRLFSTPSSIDV